MRLLLLTATIMIFSCGTNSEADKIGDEYYEKFKEEIGTDSLSAFAKSDAEMVTQFSTDSDKVREAKSWIDKFDKEMETYKVNKVEHHAKDMNFLHSIFSVKEILRTDIGCNRYNADYLINPKTQNKDSLLKAMKTFTDSVFSIIPIDKSCTTPLKCILALYTSKKEFDANTWLVLGRRLAGNSAEVEYSYWKDLPKTE